MAASNLWKTNIPDRLEKKKKERESKLDHSIRIFQSIEILIQCELGGKGREEQKEKIEKRRN